VLKLSSEIPALADTSWDELWGGLLRADIRNGDLSLLLNGDETSSTSYYNVEEGIESWAAQSLPPPNDLSSYSQPIPIKTSPIGDPLNSPALLCYGMVSYPYTLFPIECSRSYFETTAHSLYIGLPCCGESRGKYVGSGCEA
jgi:hypothetical protein